MYHLAIMDKDWDRVDIVTAYQDEEEVNPVIPALQQRIREGVYENKIVIHTVRANQPANQSNKHIKASKEHHSSL